MEHTLKDIIDYLINATTTLGPLFGVFLVILESMIPALPLAAFIALNMEAFGTFWGFIISWLASSIGCLLSFYIFKRGFSDKLYRHIKEEGKVHQFLKVIKKLSFPNLVLLIALPFTPAFLVNIACGLSKMSFQKFILAILIGKPFMIYFWGYVGVSLIENITNVSVIIRICAMLVIAYAISRLVQLKFNIKE
jgi:uncharacterized membrane protein YdjX (TVP38/TMEM64 family)